MEIKIEKHENEVVVLLNGELDTVATTNMSEELNRVTDLASQNIIIDCKDLEYVSSSGLRFFMQLKKNSEQSGGSVTIRNLNEDVEDIFRLSGFHHIFNI
ncbi:MAG: STAS domain-containing protein [Prevotella sp.]|jgi:anti-sigma B factor antagonist|nr:STAS domain-containing protein [Prevotella sp.]MBR2204201.1 STAS domain-containing protein [Prevotella sp.]